MRIEPARPLEPIALAHREFLVEVYGPLFGAIGRLALPAPVRLSDFVNEREGFLRLTDVELKGSLGQIPCQIIGTPDVGIVERESTRVLTELRKAVFALPFRDRLLP